MAFYGAQYQRKFPGKILKKTDDLINANGSITFEDGVINADEIQHSSGVFTISAPGNYYVSWSVILKTGLGTAGPCVSLLVLLSNSTTIKEYHSENTMKTGQFSGSAIIQIPTGGSAQLGLYNKGTDEFTLATNTEVKAGITFVPYVSSTSSSSFGLVGCVLTLDNTSSINLPYDSAIEFNKTTPLDDNYFGYTSSTGTIVLKQASTFLFDWSINLDGSTDASSIKFSLVEGTTSPVELAVFESTLLLQQTYTGFYYLKTDHPLTIRLINKTVGDPNGTNELFYSNTTIKAIMRIVSHT